MEPHEHCQRQGRWPLAVGTKVESLSISCPLVPPPLAPAFAASWHPSPPRQRLPSHRAQSTLLRHLGRGWRGGHAPQEDTAGLRVALRAWRDTAARGTQRWDVLVLPTVVGLPPRREFKPACEASAAQPPSASIPAPHCRLQARGRAAHGLAAATCGGGRWRGARAAHWAAAVPTPPSVPRSTRGARPAGSGSTSDVCPRAPERVEETPRPPQLLLKPSVARSLQPPAPPLEDVRGVHNAAPLLCSQLLPGVVAAGASGAALERPAAVPAPSSGGAPLSPASVELAAERIGADPIPQSRVATSVLHGGQLRGPQPRELREPEGASRESPLLRRSERPAMHEAPLEHASLVDLAP